VLFALFDLCVGVALLRCVRRRMAGQQDACRKADASSFPSLTAPSRRYCTPPCRQAEAPSPPAAPEDDSTHEAAEKAYMCGVAFQDLAQKAALEADVERNAAAAEEAQGREDARKAIEDAACRAQEADVERKAAEADARKEADERRAEEALEADVERKAAEAEEKALLLAMPSTAATIPESAVSVSTPTPEESPGGGQCSSRSGRFVYRRRAETMPEQIDGQNPARRRAETMPSQIDMQTRSAGKMKTMSRLRGAGFSVAEANLIRLRDGSAVWNQASAVANPPADDSRRAVHTVGTVQTIASATTAPLATCAISGMGDTESQHVQEDAARQKPPVDDSVGKPKPMRGGA